MNYITFLFELQREIMCSNPEIYGHLEITTGGSQKENECFLKEFEKESQKCRLWKFERGWLIPISTYYFEEGPISIEEDHLERSSK